MAAMLVRKLYFYRNILFVLYFLCAVSLFSSLALNGLYFFKKSQEFAHATELSSQLQLALQNQNKDEALKLSQNYLIEIKQIEQSVFGLQWEIFIATLCIIIFGVGMPYMLAQKIQVKIKELKKEVEIQIQNWVKTWIKELNFYGQDAYKNPDFWLKIGLLAVEQAAQYTSHPGVYMGAEMARIVRMELDKIQRT